MDRRLFLALALAGCAGPTVAPVGPMPPAPGGGALPPPPGPQPAAPEPLPTPPPSGDMAFDAWLADFLRRAQAQGVPEVILTRELVGLVPDPAVLRLDSSQPEFTRPVGAYVQGAASAERISTGRRRLAEVQAQVTQIEPRFGVPVPVVGAVWGLESAFGAIQGDRDVIRCLATLAAEGRRRAFAEAQLLAALRMIGSGEVTRAQLKGSWAGAMGQTQFIPATYLADAVDLDGDGRRDIWGSAPDALGSAANLLSKAGWRRGQGWAREVRARPGFDWSNIEGPRLTPAAWEARGLAPADGAGWGAANAEAEAELAAPSGVSGPLFLLLPNHYVIRKYNNSLAYALGVGVLADRLAGGPGLVTPWPEEKPLSRSDREGAQQALARLGFDPGGTDGVVGAGTRRALRAWQRSQSLPPDGYLTPALSARLKAQAGIP